MKMLKNKTLQAITAIYCVLYFIGFVMPFFTGEMAMSNSVDLSVLIAFLFFFSGFIVSWFNEKIGGYLLQSWVILIWLLGLFFWPDGDMAMILAIPVLVIGVFLNRRVYLKSTEPTPTKQMKWKFTLQLFLHNYVYLYFIVVIDAIISGKSIDYLGMPHILFPILLILFLAGVALSYKKELIAGIIMLIWYIVVVVGTLMYLAFYRSGPWFVFGIPILIHGILYIIYHFKVKTS